MIGANQITAHQAADAEVLEAVTDGFMVLDAEWRITYVNAAALRMSELTREEMLGRSYWQVFPASVGTPVHRHLLWAASQRRTVEFENYYEPSRRWSHVKAYPAPSGALVIFYEDITARKGVEEGQNELLRREREAREEAETLNELSRIARDMIEALPAAVYTTDAEGRITFFNTAAATLSGRVPQLGQDRWCITWKLYGSDGVQLDNAESAMALAVREGKVLQGAEFMAERPDGSRFWFIPYPTPLRDASGQIVGGINMLVDITGRKEAERASPLLGAIVDSSDDAIISKNLDGVITSWNKGAERLFGYTAEEAVGKPVTILIPPDRQSEEPSILQRLRRGERVDHFETLRVRKDGSYLNISLTISPIKDARGTIIGASKIARDITHRIRVEAALRESEERFRNLADSMPQMVWTARADGYVDYYNERWYSFTGFSRDKFGDAGWDPILHPDDRSRCRAAWSAAVQSGNPYSVEYRFWDRQEQRWRWFIGRALPARDEKTGAIVKWFGSCTEIDAQKKVEDELRHANQDLEQFAYSASHDLQEPLRAIKIYSELLTLRYRDKLDESGVQFCDHLRNGATRMEMLVHDLLVYTQISKFEPPPKRVEANEALERSLENLAGSIAESRARVTSDSLPAVRAHATHLVQIFQNLIGNAIKYRSPDRTPEIHVTARETGESFTFSVRDNGIGIDPEYKEQVFGLFKRLHTNEQFSGTGIGLAICQRIVDRYSGRIWVESQSGGGCTFFFTLPG